MTAQATASPRGRAAALGRAALVALLVLGADQLTKHLVRTTIEVGGTRRFFIGIQLVHVRNTGVAFSLLAGGGTVVLIVTLAALALLIGYLLRRPGRPWLWVPTGLLIGGAVGNLIDRIASGAVTDFVKLPLWPAFNIADTAITFGVIAFVWVIEGPRRREP